MQQRTTFPPGTSPAGSRVDWKTNLAHVILLWVYRGSATARCENLRFDLEAGQALWIPPLLARQIEHPPSAVVIAIPIPTAAAGARAHMLRVIDIPAEQTAWMLYSAMGSLSPFRSPTLTVRTVARLIDAMPARGPLPPLPLPRHPAARVAANALLENPAQNLGLRHFATLGKTSERTLRRAFAHETGMSFSHWRRLCRLRHAHRLLHSGTANDDAAMASGFGTLAALLRAQEQVLGYTVQLPLPQHQHSQDSLAQKGMEASTPLPSTGHWVHAKWHVLIWVFRGRCQLTRAPAEPENETGGEPERAEPLRRGDALWLPAGTRFSMHLEGGSLAFPLYFAATGPHAVDAGFFGTGTRLPLRVPHALEDEMLHHTLANLTAIQPIGYRYEQALETVAAIPGFPGLALPKDPLAQSITRSLRRNPSDARSLADWALALNVSERTLSRAFVSATGRGFSAWRSELRLRMAAGMLDAGFGVARTSALVGYASTTSFTRAYSRLLGSLPSASARSASRRVSIS